MNNPRSPVQVRPVAPKTPRNQKISGCFCIGIALLFKYCLRDVDTLAAAVIDVRAIVGKDALMEADGHIHRRSLPENGGAVFREAVAVKLGVAHTALAGVEVEAHLIVRKRAIAEIQPGIAVGQHSGLPAGKGAARQVDPGGSGDPHILSATAHKVNVADLIDPAVGPGGDAQRAGENGPALPIGIAQQVHRPLADGEFPRIDHRRKMDIHHRRGIHRLADLVDKGLQLPGGPHSIVLRVVIQRPDEADLQRLV